MRFTEEKINTYVPSSSDGKKIKFLSSMLKNDGDFAIVRFPYKTVADICVESVHKVKVGDYDRYVSCIRDIDDPVDKCPFCARDIQLQVRGFLKMIVYTPNQQGTMDITPCVWDRTHKWTKEILISQLTTIANFGATLEDVVCKITRHGVKGNQQTTYSLEVLDKNVYNEGMYPRDFSGFDGYNQAGHQFLVKTVDEINEYFRTGNFPLKEGATNNQQHQQQTQQAPQTFGNPQFGQPAQTFGNPQFGQAPQQFTQGVPQFGQPTQQPAQPQFGQAPQFGNPQFGNNPVNTPNVFNQEAVQQAAPIPNFGQPNAPVNQGAQQNQTFGQQGGPVRNKVFN